MINAKRIGAFISSLRKAQDWTQVEVAQRLQVTHQAVSQWEKGTTIPDIALLPPLARLLGVTVDDLLNGEVAAPRPALAPGADENESPQPAPANPPPLAHDTLEDTHMVRDQATQSPPGDPAAVVAKVGQFEFTLGQIVDLAPHVSQEQLEAILAKAKVDQAEGEVLIELAPFVSRTTLGRWVAGAGAKLDLATVIGLGPYLDRDALGGLVDERLGADQTLTWEQLEELAPHLKRGQLEALIARMPTGALPIERVVELAPFVGAALLDQLLARADNPTGLEEHLEDLAPFVSKTTLLATVSRVKSQLSTKALLNLAPFLGKDELAALLRSDE